MFIKFENTIDAIDTTSTEKEFVVDADIRVVRGALQLRDNNGTVLEQLTGLDDFQISLKTANYELIKMQGSQSNSTLDYKTLKAFLESETMPSFVVKKGETIKMQTSHTSAGSGAIQTAPFTVTLSLMYEKVKKVVDEPLS